MTSPESTNHVDTDRDSTLINETAAAVVVADTVDVTPGGNGSPDATPVRGLDTLSTISIGRLFILIFRWLLLLLVALTVEKGVDALTVKITADHQPFFLSGSTAVSLPIISNSTLVNWSYVCGILETLVIFMLMFRYFLCLIEPITELCRFDGNINFQSEDWQNCLDRITRWRISLVIFASTFEFLILIQAALALPNIKQWLSFLAMLAIFDICVFIIMPIFLVVIGISGLKLMTGIHMFLEYVTNRDGMIGGLKLCIFILVITALTLLIGLLKMAFLIPWFLFVGVCAFFVGQDSSAERRRGWLTDKFDRLKGLFGDLMREWGMLYGGWDAADLAVAMLGLLMISSRYSEHEVVGTVFSLTVVVSVLNIWRRRKIFREHLSVLTLVTQR